MSFQRARRHTGMIHPAAPMPETIDDPAFAEAAERHRRELHVHCYRMLGSFEEAEDLVQETFLRAWRRRDSYAGRASVRAWLYGIATNACLDALARRPRSAAAGTAAVRAAEVPWLQPYPDHLLDAVAPAEEEPEAATVAKETIELAFLVAIQHLPPRQRAALLARDVLDWPAAQTAELLETSVPAANSALQRARATLRELLPPRRSDWEVPEASAQERELLHRYVAASERADVDALAATLRDDVRFSMPPEPFHTVGRDATVQGWISGGFGGPEWSDFRCLLTHANRQPAVACYVRKPGSADHRLFVLDVLRIEDGMVAEIVTFSGAALKPLGLPDAL
jgi:RNA polymerase sigma-70 factor, ECF subfamily